MDCALFSEGRWTDLLHSRTKVITSGLSTEHESFLELITGTRELTIKVASQKTKEWYT